MTRVLDSERVFFNELKYNVDIHCICGAAVTLDSEYKKDATCKVCGRTYFIRFDVRYSELLRKSKSERRAKKYKNL
ncbi:MAG: hypothetical protein ACTSRG_09855 [Candidatus Helarchaeota archaeon]